MLVAYLARYLVRATEPKHQIRETTDLLCEDFRRPRNPAISDSTRADAARLDQDVACARGPDG